MLSEPVSLVNRFQRSLAQIHTDKNMSSFSILHSPFSGAFKQPTLPTAAVLASPEFYCGLSISCLLEHSTAGINIIGFKFAVVLFTYSTNIFLVFHHLSVPAGNLKIGKI